jgi:glycosyltransferase involved in cell wall biosynthesis
MNIAVIFPYNNIFSKERTKPVVLAGLPYITNSTHHITVISRFTNTPIKYHNILLTPQNTNKQQYYNEVLKLANSIPLDLIEVHQDLLLAGFIAKKTNKKVSLIKHGAYLVNNFKEKFLLYRKFIEFMYLKYIHSVYCISNHVCSELKKKYNNYHKKFLTVYNTYGHIKATQLNKSHKKGKIICYAGKPTTYKGFFQILPALNKVLKTHPKYKVIFMLSFFNNNIKQQCEVDKLLKNMFYQQILSKKLEIYYNLANKDVFTILQKSKILLVPTITKEPFGLIALEGYLAGCIVISTAEGGLKEIAEESGIYFNNIKKTNQIYNTISAVINSYNILLPQINKTLKSVSHKFNPIRNTKLLDNHRSLSKKE